MNSKKAKRLRQLVRVMQDKGVVDGEWEVNGHIKHDIVVNNPKMFDASTNPTIELHTAKQSVLKPECGKAVYKQMKKRTINENL